MHLIFSHVHPQKPLGTFDSIRLDVEGMRAEREDELVALYRWHQWSVEGLDYFRLDCTGRVAVHFERAAERSNRYGPFELYYDVGYHWPVMVVTDLRSN
jgi:hypothetical protein